MEMDLSGEGMTMCVIEPIQSGTHESSKNLLSMVASKSCRIKVALKELQDAKMRRYGIPSLLLLFENDGLVRWRKVHLCEKWIDMPSILVRLSHQLKLKELSYLNLGSNIPSLRWIVRSHASATSVKILGSVRGFLCIRPSHSETPILIDSLVKI
jgi:hypothetical protein